MDPTQISRRRKPPTDLMGMLEAIYALEQSREAWTRQLLAATRRAFGGNLTVGAVLYRLDDTTIHLDHVEGPDTCAEWLRVARESHADPHMVAALRHAYRYGLWAETSEPWPGVAHAVHARYRRRMSWSGSFVVNGHDGSGAGCCINLLSEQRLRFSVRQRETLTRMATHLAAGYRLQRRLAVAADQAPVEAVLTATGHIEHAEPCAKDSESLRQLACAASARCQSRSEDAELVIANRSALVAGRWTLVDEFQTDGKHYILARQNAPAPAACAALSERERQVTALATLGRSNKMIAYELGLAHATVRVLLARSAAKLHVKTREELIARFASAGLADCAATPGSPQPHSS